MTKMTLSDEAQRRASCFTVDSTSACENTIVERRGPRSEKRAGTRRVRTLLDKVPENLRHAEEL